MLRPRVIPVMSLRGRQLVKTVRFRDPIYLGDPINAARLFNTKEVDEIVVLDITATTESRSPDIDYLGQLASEFFMPLCYGGGVRSVEDMEAILKTGVEKVAVNSSFLADEQLVSRGAEVFGEQAIVASIDVVTVRRRGARVAVTSPSVRATDLDPAAWARRLVDLGAGEILLTSVERDGTADGYDLELIEAVASAVPVPVIALGGAGNATHLREALRAGASAAAAGRLFTTRGKHLASLVSYPEPQEIEALAL